LQIFMPKHLSISVTERKAEIREKYRTGEKALTFEESQRFLAVIDDVLHEGLFKLAVWGGLRREDVVNVKKADLNEQEKMLSFYERKKRKIHTIFLSQDVLNALVKLKKLYPKEEYMFHGRSEKKYNTGHLSSRQAYNVFQYYLDRLGLEHRPFHALRSTCIKNCQHMGWAIEKTANHVDDTIRTIQEHYMTPSMAEMKQIASEKNWATTTRELNHK
jgi:integrase